eukprot:scaffold11760_cov108-Isochrysis_galbana.AAC.6
MRCRRGMERAGHALSYLDVRRGRDCWLGSEFSSIGPVYEAVACCLSIIQGSKVVGRHSKAPHRHVMIRTVL